MKFRCHQHQLSRGLSEAQTEGWAWAGEDEMKCPAYSALPLPAGVVQCKQNKSGNTHFPAGKSVFKKGFQQAS
jgi:hypothetical protein